MLSLRLDARDQPAPVGELRLERLHPHLVENDADDLRIDADEVAGPVVVGERRLLGVADDDAVALGAHHQLLRVGAAGGERDDRQGRRPEGEPSRQ